VLLLAILALLVALAVRVSAAPSPPIAPVDPVAEPDEAEDGELDVEPDALLAPAPTAITVVSAKNEPAATGREVAMHTLPPISAVVAAAYRASSLDSSPAAGWRWRARLAGLVPMLTVRDGRDATWRDIADPTIGYVSVFTVSATWKLDRLLFDTNELRISAIEAARRRERRHIAAETIRAYYTFARAGDPDRGAEAAAVLDALTDGWFSDQLQHR
jgi:hypothetical protein